LASPEFEEPGKYPLGVLPEGLGGVGMGLGQGGAALTQVFRLHFSKPDMIRRVSFSHQREIYS